MTLATIQRGGVAMINTPTGIYARVGFFGYSYTVDGSQYAGLFAILCDPQDSERFQQKLSGGKIQIRYNPSNPETSFVENLRDPRFEGYKASQDPNWLSQAPDAGIRDPIP